MSDTARDRAEKLAAEHRLITGSAGNGYTEPRETWATCSCGALLHSWQEFYDENDEEMEDAYAQHIAYVALEKHAAEIAAAKAQALREAAQMLEDAANLHDHPAHQVASEALRIAQRRLELRADGIERPTDDR